MSQTDGVVSVITAATGRTDEVLWLLTPTAINTPPKLSVTCMVAMNVSVRLVGGGQVVNGVMLTVAVRTEWTNTVRSTNESAIEGSVTSLA